MGPPEKLQSRAVAHPSAGTDAFSGATEEAREALARIRKKLAEKAACELGRTPARAFSVPVASVSRPSRKRNELYRAILESLLRSWDRVQATASDAIGQLRNLEAASSWRDGRTWSTDLLGSFEKVARTAQVGRAVTEFLGSFPVPFRRSWLSGVSAWTSRLCSWMAVLGVGQEIPPQVRYSVDRPSMPFSCLEGGFLQVAGWAFEEQGKAAEAIWVEWDGKRWYCQRRLRPDVGAVYPEVKEKPSCGFELSLVLPPGLHRLELKARWSKGSVSQLGVFWVYSTGPVSL